jgi:hypothetical protein
LIAGIGFAISLPGCGKALVSGDELSSPLFQVSGDVVPKPDQAELPRLSLGILWIDPLGSIPGNWVSGGDVIAGALHADGTFDLDIYARPPDAAIRRIVSDSGSSRALRAAWGEIVLFDDNDQDDGFRVGPLSEGSPMLSDDRYRGVDDTHVLTYIAEPLLSDDQPIPELGGLLQGVAGYQMMSTECSDQTPQLHLTQGARFSISLLPPSTTFPLLRKCLQAHPTMGP